MATDSASTSMTISIDEFSQLQSQIMTLREELFVYREREQKANKTKDAAAGGAAAGGAAGNATQAQATSTTSGSAPASATAAAASALGSFFSGAARENKELEELRHETSNLKRLLQQHQQEAAMKQQALQENIKTFSQENDELQQQVVALQKQLATDDRAPTSAMEERIRQLESDVARYKNEIVQLSGDSSTFVSKITEKDLELDALRETLEAERETIQRERDSLSKQLAAKDAECDEQKAQLRLEIKSLQETVADMEKQASERLKWAQESDGRVAEFEELLTLKSQNIRALREEIQTLKEANEKLQAKAEQHRAEVDQQIALLQEKETVWKEETTVLRATVGTITEKYSRVEKELNSMSIEKEEIRSQFTREITELQERLSKCTTYEKELNDLKGTLAKLETEKAEQAAQLEQQKHLLETATQEAQEKQQLAESLQTKTTELQDALTAATTKIDELQKEAAEIELRHKLDAKKKQRLVVDLQSQLQKARSKTDLTSPSPPLPGTSSTTLQSSQSHLDLAQRRASSQAPGSTVASIASTSGSPRSHRRTLSSAGALQAINASAPIARGSSSTSNTPRGDAAITSRNSASISASGSGGSAAVSMPSAAAIVKLSQEPPATIQAELTNLFKRLAALAARNRKLEDMIRSQQASIEKLTSDCQKKSALIQHHLADISLGRSSAAQDRNRTQRRQEGGIMAALFGGTAKSDLDAEVLAEINTKISRVLEETILQNVELRTNLDTIGNEVRRLELANQKLTEQLSSRTPHSSSSAASPVDSPLILDERSSDGYQSDSSELDGEFTTTTATATRALSGSS